MTPTEYTNLPNNFETVTYPTKTYSLDTENNRVVGYTSGIEAMKQAIYKILATERFENIIYSWNYGIEIENYQGKLYQYIYSVLSEKITEALMQDDRITDVYDFEFTKNRKNKSLLVTFSVTTTQGNANISTEVKV